MDPVFDGQNLEPFALQKKPNDKHRVPITSLASNGFSIWWQKTAANNMAMVTEASNLMRAHQMGNFAHQPRAGQAH